ncbi:MAG: TrkA family potassium uptake protein [Microscillaceae bacterium]|jgi:trk system potassium uptake protein TrkA|nr:TrkA family potassium uptake protein [Microscillaceae bacterium]
MKFAVIGLGQFGFAIARALAREGSEVLAIDNNSERVEQIKDEVAHAVALDATDRKVLEAQNIQELDAVVVAIGEDFEALLMTTVQLMELKVPRLIARASNDQQRMILQKLGITEILSPEEEVGKTFAKSLLNPNIRSFLPLPDGYEIVEVNTPKKIADKTVSEVDLRKRYNLNLITIKRLFEESKDGKLVQNEHIIGVPRPDTILLDTDVMIVLGKAKDVEKFVQLNR